MLADGRLDRAREVAATVTDPELPMLTLADLGVLRSVELDGEHLVVTITPTYTGCPAMATMRADLLVALRRNGFDDVEVRTSLSPAWSTDWLTERGRRALAEHGIAPPGPARPASSGPVPLVLGTRAPSVRCPRCGSLDTRELSRFGSTACKSLHACRACAEPFDHFKELA
ncbi:phenylacetate-CoA oxygenase subunit PaaJ [Angustibacter aerolatus]